MNINFIIFFLPFLYNTTSTLKLHKSFPVLLKSCFFFENLTFGYTHTDTRSCSRMTTIKGSMKVYMGGGRVRKGKGGNDAISTISKT